MVLDWLRTAFGDVTWREVTLAALWSVCIVLYRHLPRLGEAIGSLFERHP